MEAEPYLAHMEACINRHIANWPIHAVDWGGLGATGCPILCGKPHGEPRYRCPQCGILTKTFGEHKHTGSFWREGSGNGLAYNR